MTRKNTNPLTAEGVTYYHSGSNHPGEIEGWASIGAPIGVAVNELSREAIEALKATAGAVPVFVDSGAFSEVTFPNGIPTVTKPIDAAEWANRLAVYQELADALGSALTVVAPDQIAFPAETLDRLETYRAEVAALAAAGARVLVCLQGTDKVAFWAEAQAVLGLSEVDGLCPALPMKKNATAVEEAAHFVATVQPASVHCLGLGARNQNAAELVRQLRELDADVEITLDSNALRANVGRNHADKGRASAPLTAALDAITNEWVAAGELECSFELVGQRWRWVGKVSRDQARRRKAEAIRRAFTYGPAGAQLSLF